MNKNASPFKPESAPPSFDSLADRANRIKEQLRQLEAADMQKKPKPPQRIPGQKAVRDFLEKEFPKDPKKKELCPYPGACDIWPVEDILLKDLNEAKAKSPEKVNELRKLIRAASWEAHKQKRTGEMVARARKFKDELEAQYAEVAKTDPEEANETWKPLAEHARDMYEALRDGTGGEEAEAGTVGAEIIFDRELQKVLNTLNHRRMTVEEALALPASNPTRKIVERFSEEMRPIRDQIYYQRLFPGWREAVESSKK